MLPMVFLEPRSEEANMLSIRNLTHTYPNGVQALKKINLEIPKGLFGLLGPNGAGKSTLMRTIATLQQPTTGSISFGDLDVLEQPNAARRTLGYLPQDFGVYPRGSAYDLLDHLAILKGIPGRKERKQVVEGLLAQTNLFEVRKKRLSSFSGGMRQRFGVAQALIGDPQLIIVDEPTAGLDPAERNRFHNILAEIGEDIVVILSTHIVDDVADLCPNMAILAEGRIVSEGKPSDLRQEIEGRMWRKIVDRSELEALRAELNVISNHLSAGKMEVRVNAASRPGAGFEESRASLEDVYFSAVGVSLRGNTSAVATLG